MRKQKGFSLIELLIVVAIILIIAAIAIPNLLRAKIAANESSAAASIRTISSSELLYQQAYNTVGYPASLAIIGPVDAGCTAGPAVGNACIIDFSLARADATGAAVAKSGYLFAATGSTSTGAAPNDRYVGDGRPATVNSTGVKEFCGADDNVVRSVSPSPDNKPAGQTRAGCLALVGIG